MGKPWHHRGIHWLLLDVAPWNMSRLETVPYSAAVARPEVKDYLASEMQTETASGGFTGNVRTCVNWSQFTSILLSIVLVNEYQTNHE